MKSKKKKVRPEDYLSPHEKAAIESISVAGYKVEGRVLGDSIIEWKKMLRRIFDKLAAAMEEYSE